MPPSSSSSGAEELNAKDARGTGPYPSNVRVAPRYAIRSIGGILGGPYNFMLRELRRRFSRDWDRAVDAREGRFRGELVDFFRPLGIQVLEREKKLRVAGRTLTDVDAAFADPKNGTLGLFQLKWQDQFGSSMSERSSRMRNFVEGSNKWIQAMEEWLADRLPAVAARDVGFAPEIARKMSKVRLFVLGRSFASFSIGVERRLGAAWGSWAQVRRDAAAEQTSFAQAPLDFIDSSLRNNVRWSAAGALPPKPVRIPIGEVTVDFHISLPSAMPSLPVG